MGLFSSKGNDTQRAERNARELRARRGDLARSERELREYRGRHGRGDGSTTRRINADIESCRQAIRLFGG